MKEGTVFVEINPPAPWPVGDQKMIGPRLPLGGAENWLRIFARVDGRLKIELSEMAIGTIVLTTCPIHFDGGGYFRLGVAWSDDGKNPVAYAGGMCVASNDPATKAVTSATIPLKPSGELSKWQPEEGELRMVPGNTGYSI